MKTILILLIGVQLCVGATNKRTYYQTFLFHDPPPPLTQPASTNSFVISTEAASCDVTITEAGSSPTTITITNASPTIHALTAQDGVGIKVEAECDIVLYGLSYKTLSADTHLGLSVHEIGSEYVVLGLEKMRTDNSLYPMEVSVVAVEDDTCCTYQFPDGTQRSVNLNSLDVDALKDTEKDYTGTRISCNKKVSVFSGQRCTQMVPSCAGCDHVYEQLPPVRSLGRRFNLVPYSQACSTTPACCQQSQSQFCSRCTEVFRVVAIEDDTDLMWVGSVTSSNTANLNAGQSTYVLLDQTEVAQLASTKNVLIGQIAPNSFAYYNSATNTSDPSLAVVQRRESYRKSYQVASCIPGFDTHYANLVIKQGTAAQVKLNGAAFLNPSNGVAIPGSNLETHRHQFDCSSANGGALQFSITHDDNEKFGVTLFGIGVKISYAHPAAL